MGSYGTPDLMHDTNVKFYKCKKCGIEYYADWKRCPQCKTPKGKGKPVNAFFTFILIFIIVTALVYAYQNGASDIIEDIISNESSGESNISKFASDTPEEEIGTLEAIEPPQTGVYQIYTTNELLARFEIIKNNDNVHHLFKFIDSGNNSTIMTFFLRKNEDATIKVPLGTYKLLMASGDTWYGDQELFGSGTTIIEYDYIFNFYFNGTGYQGLIMSLEKVPDGKLQSKRISKDDFQ